MELIPTTPKKIAGDGKFDNYPVIASNGNKVLAMWRHASTYNPDRASGHIRAALSVDGGATWGSPYVALSDASNTVEEVPGGLAWDATRSVWMLGTVRRKFSSTGTLNGFAVRAYTSPDGKAWTVATDLDLPIEGVQWGIASAVQVSSEGAWRIYASGRVDDELRGIFVFISVDGGQTWTPAIEPVSRPDGVDLGDVAVTDLPSGDTLLIARCDQEWSYHQFRSQDGVNFSYEGVIAMDVSGPPALAYASSGTLVCLARERPTIDGVHGRWRWITSDDEGLTWMVRDTWPDRNRFAVGGALTPVNGGVDLACVFSSEDDPRKPFGSASLYSTRLRFTPVAVSRGVDPDTGASYVSVLAPSRVPIMRELVDPLTGARQIDEVRVTSLVGGGGQDYEVPQGWKCTYSVGERQRSFTMPTLSSMWMIHPTRPELNMPFEVVTDGQRSYGLDVQVTSVPQQNPSSGEVLSTPVVTSTGTLGAPTGQTVIRTRTLRDKARLLALWRDLTPIFLSTHIGSDLPQWIRLTSEPQEDRVIQTCSCSHDDASDMAQWRTWTIQWVEQARPSVAGMPMRRRIKDVHVPVKLIDKPIRRI